MKVRLALSFILCAFVILSPAARNAQADEIYLDTGEKLKGLVVEEYCDRIVFSQEKGEIEIMRSLIDEIFYDTQIQNYLYLGDTAFYEKKFDTALEFYEKAKQMDSKDTRALDAIYRTYDAISRNGMNFDLKGIQAILLKQLGIVIKSVDGRIRVAKESILAAEYLSVGDYITAVFGLPTKYMNEDMAAELMVGRPGTFIKLEVEKTITLVNQKQNKIFTLLGNANLGFRLVWKTEGLIITYIKKDGPADKGGLKVGDIVTGINGSPTRYMPIEKVNRKISRGILQNYTFNVRRSLFVKRRAGN